jgi:hypothetical protein
MPLHASQQHLAAVVELGEPLVSLPKQVLPASEA